MSMSILSDTVFKHLFYIFRTVFSVKEEDFHHLHVYVVVNFFMSGNFCFSFVFGYGNVC